jgi:hypothetical protein
MFNYAREMLAVYGRNDKYKNSAELHQKERHWLACEGVNLNMPRDVS